MKKICIMLGLAVALCVQSAVPVPNVGNGRVRILGNNLQNYYYNYAESERPSYSTDEGRAEKTRKIVEMMLQSNADIFAFCEVEAKPIVLQQLADSLNKTAGVSYYATVNDGISIVTDSYDNALKSGFIYRTDKVKPYGSNYAATNVTYYKNVMRIQAWEEIATGERFTLSMNHFKAKSDEASVAKRVENAGWLVSALGSYRVQDPDILVMGDLNAEMDEECISTIQKAGFEEQLLRFDSASYSYVYYSTHELIDHAFANTSMAEQITGAAVWHTNTPLNYSSRYSDHDAYLVAVNLGEPREEGECQPVDFTESFSASLGEFTPVSITGTSNWFWNTKYSCAYMNAYQTAPDEDWLVSPAFDFSGQESGTIRFSHALGYGTQSEYPNQCKLKISDDYAGDVATASWTDLTIDNWSTSNFEWKDNTVAIPEAFMQKKNIYFAFCYNVASSAPAWEIKNLSVQTVCGTGETTELTETAEPPVRYKKILHNGQLIIEVDGVQYTITGQRL
ncbi:MAG: choice-of-anchor J domain-containing protein [Paludibacteraceae bacterium]|nr:choice-of-anchor J domain-containing protein [Paludibacteraceae bacterium]